MKAAREEAGCAALPEEEAGCAALFEPAREEAGRFIEVVTMDALKRMVVNS